MPFGLKLQREAEKLASVSPATAHLLQRGGAPVPDGHSAAVALAPEANYAVLADAAPAPGGPIQLLDNAPIRQPDNITEPNRLGARNGAPQLGDPGSNVAADAPIQIGHSELDRSRSDTGVPNALFQLAQSEGDGETRGGRPGGLGAFYDAFITARYGAIYNNLKQLQPGNYTLSTPSLRAGPPTAAEVSELEVAYRVAQQTQPLANRATEVLRSLNDPVAEDHYRTVTVLRTTDGTFVAGSGERGLQAPQRALLTERETPVRTQGLHAEINALTFARGRPLYIGTSRDFCSQCVEQITRAGGIITSPRTAYFPLNGSPP